MAARSAPLPKPKPAPRRINGGGSPDARDTFWDNAHKVHCCPTHGCRWDDPGCPVVTGIIEQYGGRCPQCVEDAAPAAVPGYVHVMGYQYNRPEPPPLPPPTQRIGLKSGGPPSTPLPSLGTALFKLAINRQAGPVPPQEPLGDRLDRIFRSTACAAGGAGLAIGFMLGLWYGA